MEKKVEDILEAFEHHRFEDALRQIDQLMKKVIKDAKKKNTLTENDNRTLQMVKCGCLASIGKLHEANQIMENYFTQKIISEMSDKQKFMFASIAQMAYDDKLLNKIELLNKTGKGDVRLQRFMLSHRLFSIVSKSFLKQYAKQKRQEDGLAQIFLEYINELNKAQPIEDYYSRDLLIQENKQLNLKMIDLFFMKYFTAINLSKLENVKLRSSIIDLRIRLAINSGKVEDAKKFYLEHFEYIQQNFVYLRSIRQMPQNQLQNHRFYIQNCGVVFCRNLEIQKYVPLYDYYDEFLDFILSEKITKDFSGLWSVLQNSEQLPVEQLYSFKKVSNDQVLVNYYRSLNQELKSLIEGQKHQLAKKSDYYKISIKGLMLQLLKVLYFVAHKNASQVEAHKLLADSQSFNKILDVYFREFAKTFTYPNQMRLYIPFLKERFEKVLDHAVSEKPNIRLPNDFEKPDDNLILLTNAVKLLVVLKKSKLSDWKQTEKWVQLSWSFYQQFIEEVEQTKRRQKGEIFLSDEFAIILSDIIVYHIENVSNFESIETQSFIESILLNLMAILDYTTELSPFNGYLKLRLIYVCQKLNYFDKLIDTYLSLDIKSVQFETLGYFLVNPLNSFNLYSQSEQRLVRMVRSYQQNQRETSEYCLKGLKAGTTYQVFEYFSYQKRLERSFSKMNLFYTLYLKYQRKQHSEFYLNWIQKNMNQFKTDNKKINFNCDTKTMQNILLSLYPQSSDSGLICPYNEYYGYLNSPQVFQLQVQFRKLETLFRAASETKSPQSEKLIEAQIIEAENKFSILQKSANISQLYDIERNFYVINEYLWKNSSSEKAQKSNNQTFTLSKVKKQFLFYLKVVELKLAFFKSFKSVLHLLQKNQNDEALTNEAKQQFKLVFGHIECLIQYLSQNMLWREQVKNCWFFRETLFTGNHLVKIMNEEAGKLKKLPKSIKSAISQFSNDLQKTVLASVSGIKFGQNLKVNPDILNLTIDKKYLIKVEQRDEILRRTSSMNQKQAKDFLLR